MPVCLQADCRRFNRRLKRGTCGLFSLSRLRRQLPHQREPKISLPLMRKVSARLVAMTEGENNISFDALNLWAAKRGLQISQNRIETQNPRPLNLWGRGFAFYNTAVAGCKRPAFGAAVAGIKRPAFGAAVAGSRHCRTCKNQGIVLYSIITRYLTIIEVIPWTTN